MIDHYKLILQYYFSFLNGQSTHYTKFILNFYKFVMTQGHGKIVCSLILSWRILQHHQSILCMLWYEMIMKLHSFGMLVQDWMVVSRLFGCIFLLVIWNIIKKLLLWILLDFYLGRYHIIKSSHQSNGSMSCRGGWTSLGWGSSVEIWSTI